MNDAKCCRLELDVYAKTRCYVGWMDLKREATRGAAAFLLVVLFRWCIKKVDGCG